MGLPEPAVGGGPSGQGATYFLANGGHSSAINVFPKQAYVEVKDVFNVKGQSLRVGRLEVMEGIEAVANDDTLAALRRERLSSRLLGNFSYSHVPRSLDGAEFTLNRPTTNVTAVAGRLTQGVFQVDGWSDLDVAVAYGSVTRGSVHAGRSAEWRLFGIGYGWQPHLRLSPWIRGGVDWSSGDSDPNDTTHGTFFQVAPTPRIYARFPFFNAMNNTDAFGEVVVRPSKRTRARVDGECQQETLGKRCLRTFGNGDRASVIAVAKLESGSKLTKADESIRQF